MSLASSHREAPLISNDPLADNTDRLCISEVRADSTKIVLIANYIPFEHPAGGPNWYTFGENIRYEIHVDNNTATQLVMISSTGLLLNTINEDSTTFFRIRLGKENWKTTYTLERSMNGGAYLPPSLPTELYLLQTLAHGLLRATVGLGSTDPS